MAQPNAGVYALTHRTLGKIYIGSSHDFKRRRHQWWQTMNHDPQDLPPVMRSITTSREDWVFSVVWDGTNATPEQLKQVELEVVDALRHRAPGRLLNVLPVVRPDTAGLTAGGRTQSVKAWSRETGVNSVTIATRYQQLGWTPEQAVGLLPPPVRDYTTSALDHAFASARVLILDGNVPLTRRQAAARLNCRVETLTTRLQKYQIANGQARVQLSELLEKSKKYRRN